LIVRKYDARKAIRKSEKLATLTNPGLPFRVGKTNPLGLALLAVVTNRRTRPESVLLAA
jgi:hypothetical protein